MKKITLLPGLLLTGFLIFRIGICFGQAPPHTPTREERFKKQEGKMIYPLIKGSYRCGVIPVSNPAISPNPDSNIKLIFDFTQATSNNNQATHINEGLEEVARVLNLHIAAGVKKEKLKAAIVFHSGSILSVLSDNYYQENYHTANPNTGILNQLTAAGVEMFICGQSLELREIPATSVMPSVKVALSAKTTLSMYDANGYYGFTIKE